MRVETGVPTPADIAMAERYRSKGFYGDALSLMRPVLDVVTSHGLDGRSNQEQAQILASLRILASAEISEAHSSWAAPRVAFGLEKAAFVFSRGYDHPEVQKASRSIRIGPFGESYDHSTEQLRDRAKFFLSLALLTGNSGFIDEAIKMLDRAFLHSHEPAAQTLVRFEQAVLERRQKRQTFQEVETRAGEALFAAYDQGNWERAATIGSRFVLLALKEGRLRTVGLFALHTVASIVNNTSLWTIPFREAWKFMTGGIRQYALRWTTPSGIRYDYLADRVQRYNATQEENRELSDQILWEVYALLTSRGRLLSGGMMLHAEIKQAGERGCSAVRLTHLLREKKLPDRYHTAVKVTLPVRGSGEHWILVVLDEGRSESCEKGSGISRSGEIHTQRLEHILSHLQSLPLLKD